MSVIQVAWYLCMNLLNLQKVKLKPANDPPVGELSDKIHYECHFCGKTCGLSLENREICERISGGDFFYCPFCVRHDYYTKSSQHILPLSFRSVMGYFYHALYSNKVRKMWLSEIKDYESEHVKIGLQSPIFNYDPDTCLWFIDFSKVGHGRKKVEVEEVLKTVMNILACFNLYEHLHGNPNRFYEKYREAIVKFHENRYRPNDRRFLIPTLTTVGNADFPKGITMESTRDFLPNKMRTK